MLGEKYNVLPTRVPHSNSVKPYNFGYTPLEVIKKFQDFVLKFATLTDAINELLLLDRNLKSNYQFIKVSVTYRMLTGPTVTDDTEELKQAILKLHKYSRDKGYKTVSNAIEELIISS